MFFGTPPVVAALGAVFRGSSVRAFPPNLLFFPELFSLHQLFLFSLESRLRSILLKKIAGLNTALNPTEIERLPFGPSLDPRLA